MGRGKGSWLALWAALVFTQGSSSFGLVVAGGDANGNTAAPGNDPGWANVGSYNDGGCVYIGNGWVLTAGHVYSDNPSGDPVFGTTAYTPDGTHYTIQDPANTSYNADLAMFHLTTIPADLPALALTMSSSQPPVSSPVTAIGYGYARQSTELYWNSSWQPMAGTPGSYAYAGYELGALGPERWGTNTIVGGTSGDDGTGTVTNLLDCMFNSTGGPNNFQFVSHDSGGGVFYQGPNGWQLTGIILAQATIGGQPGNTAVYDDASYFGDLSSYHSQIMQQVLSDALPGDANLDGRVDINDLTLVLEHYNQTGMTWATGDFNGDGRVDINDLVIVLHGYNTSVASSAAGAVGRAAVPESSSVALVLAAAACLLARAWRRRWLAAPQPGLFTGSQ